jgi:hydroxymethylglutaryl-CoA lyase
MTEQHGLPVPVPLPGLPQRVTIWEVGARDGLQNEAVAVPLDVKLAFIERLADAGLGIIEATSMVRPEWVPQLADAGELLGRLQRRPEVRYPVLVPNPKGLARAADAGVRDVAVFASATETFAAKNLNRTLDTQWEMFEPTIATARESGMSVRGYVSMCFGDPWEGAVDPDAVVAVCRRLVDLGCSSISLGDTIGVATPGQVVDLIWRLNAAGLASDVLAVHFHDTYGQALANTLAALQAGVATVDASAGGLGGCPYARSATGNLATEDLVWMLDGLGIETGVHLAALAATSAWMAEQLGRAPASCVVRALQKTP